MVIRDMWFPDENKIVDVRNRHMNYIVGEQSEVFNSYWECLVNVEPRAELPTYKRVKEVVTREPWTYKDSYFAPYKLDTDEICAKACMADLAWVKFPKMEIGDKASLGEYLKRNYRYIKDIY